MIRYVVYSRVEQTSNLVLFDTTIPRRITTEG